MRSTKRGSGDAILRCVGAAVKTAIAHGMQPFGWRVPQHACDELVGVHTQGLDATVPVVGVAHAHQALGVERQLTVVGHGTALDVPGQIQRDTARVLVGRLDLDIPVRAIELADRGQPVRQSLLRRQSQVLQGEHGLQASQQLAPEQDLQRFEREQEAGAAGLPLLVQINATGADQAVHMGVLRQIAAPGVQGHEKPWAHAQALGVAHQFEQRVTHAVKQQRSHGGTIERPQWQQHMRQREHDVEVRAVQQTCELGVDPELARPAGTPRTTAVAASTVLSGFEVPVRASQGLGAESASATTANALRGAQLARVQATLLGVAVEVSVEDILHRTAHGARSETSQAKVTPTVAARNRDMRVRVRRSRSRTRGCWIYSASTPKAKTLYPA